MNQHFRLFSLLVFLAIGALLLLGNPTGTSWAAPHTPDDIDIVGGDPVPDPNPFVWQVSLQLGNDHICGGSVIADKWVLTAAHCLSEGPSDGNLGANYCEIPQILSEFSVIIGRRQLNDTTGMVRGITRCFLHDYDYLLGLSKANDIALIELDDSIPDAERYIIPLMTANRENTISQAGTWATVTGWGGMIPDNRLSISNILMQLETPITAQDSCRNAWSTVGIPILDSMVCAGFEAGGSSVCQGDSGGALVVADYYGGYVQNGIVSFGPSTCAEPGRVPVYTRVSSYIGWLESVTGLDFTTPRAPDLVVKDIHINANDNLEIVIKNQGNARVALDQGFWVDLYINPDPVPTGVNQTWNFVSDYGAVWGVDQTGFVLLPEQTVSIELNDKVFWPTLSELPELEVDGQRYPYIPVGAEIYAQVDSANANTDYGAILELHELFGGTYNNISSPYITVDDLVFLVASTESTALPERIYLPLVANSGNAATAASIPATQPSTQQTTQLPPRTSTLEATK